jgi:hypothetical protein
MTHDPADTQRDLARERFEALLRTRIAAPFEWGVNDCCLFAADAVQAITGEDLAADLRGAYGSALEAARVLRDVGGIEAAAARAGDEIAPLAATWGDVGLIRLDDRELLAVCTGANWVAPAAGGLAARSLPEAVKAWRVRRG